MSQSMAQFFDAFSGTFGTGKFFRRTDINELLASFWLPKYASMYILIQSDSMVQAIGFSLSRIRSNDSSISSSFGRTP